MGRSRPPLTGKDHKISKKNPSLGLCFLVFFGLVAPVVVVVVLIVLLLALGLSGKERGEERTRREEKRGFGAGCLQKE